MLGRIIRHGELKNPAHVWTAGLLLATNPLTLGAAILLSGRGFAVACTLGLAADVLLHVKESSFIRFLGRLKYGLSVRSVLRHNALLLLPFTLDAPPTELLWTSVVALLSFDVLRLFHFFSCVFIRRRRALPVRVRNIDLSALNMPAPPPGWAYRAHSVKLLLYLDIPLTVGFAGTAWTKWWPAAAIGVAVSTAGAMTGLLALIPTVSRCRRVPGPRRVFDTLNKSLAVRSPEVVLYFSYAAGARDSAYQVNMWLETLAELDKRVLIVLREVTTLRFLGYTPLPVICVPKADDLSLVELPIARVILYPANAGKNVHMLRVAEAQHVFIGHGDSDKAASSNRVSKVYDQIWVAGEAGQVRYSRVRHAIDGATLVKVGRPQLTNVQRAGTRNAERIPTVLYAPTWEGWTADPFHTSLVLMGPKIIRMLIHGKDPVRILYRPHPLTGKRSADAEAAHRRIVEMLDSDNARREGSRTQALRTRRAEGDLVLGALERQMECLKRWSVAGVYGTWRKDREFLTHPPRSRWNDLRDAWHREFWHSRDLGTHRVLSGQLPTLNESFNQADLLISDISSVVSDYLASEKPYAVTNPAGLDEVEFKTLNPAASAAYLLGPSCELLETCVRAARGEEDRLVERRRTLRRYLLGDGDPQQRFNNAVNTLFDLAARHYPPGATAASVIPGPFDHADDHAGDYAGHYGEHVGDSVPYTAAADR